MACRGLIKDVIITLGIKWRIEVDQINGIVREVVPIPQDFEIVTVVQGIGMKGHPMPFSHSVKVRIVGLRMESKFESGQVDADLIVGRISFSK